MSHAINKRIISKIRSGGPMPFELFMALALYDADGFFGGDKLRSGKGRRRPHLA